MSRWTYKHLKAGRYTAANVNNAATAAIHLVIHRGAAIDGEPALPDAGDIIHVQEMAPSIEYIGMEVVSGGAWSGGNIDIGYARSKPAYRSQYHTQPNGPLPANDEDDDYFGAGIAVGATRVQVITGVPKPMLEWESNGHQANRNFIHNLTIKPTTAPAVGDSLWLIAHYLTHGG